MKIKKLGRASFSGNWIDLLVISTFFCLLIPLSANSASIPELVFPRNPGTPGTSLPSDENTSGLADFDVMNYRGSDDGENERMFWRLDPLGSARTVVRFELHDGDVGDSHGGHRVELGYGQDDHFPGENMWQAFAIYLPADFKTPDTWNIFKQNHTGSRSGQPMQTFRVEPDSNPNTVTNLEFHSKSGVSGGGRIIYSLGKATRQKWHFFVMYLELRTDSSGLTRVWYAPDSPPNLNLAPNVERQSATIDSAPGYDRFGMYRSQGSSDHYPMTVYFWGYGRAATATRAMQNAGFSDNPDNIQLGTPGKPYLMEE